MPNAQPWTQLLYRFPIHIDRVQVLHVSHTYYEIRTAPEKRVVKTSSVHPEVVDTVKVAIIEDDNNKVKVNAAIVEGNNIKANAALAMTKKHIASHCKVDMIGYLPCSCMGSCQEIICSCRQ